MKIKYIEKRFSESSKRVISSANAIIAEYTAQGYELGGKESPNRVVFTQSQGE